MADEMSNEIVVDVEDVGQFVFAKRNMRRELAISVELRRLTEGVPLDEFTLTFMRAIAELKKLTLEAPEKFTPEKLDDLDPYDDANYTRILKIWGALREKERPFRGDRARVQAGGEDASGDL